MFILNRSPRVCLLVLAGLAAAAIIIKPTDAATAVNPTVARTLTEATQYHAPNWNTVIQPQLVRRDAQIAAAQAEQARIREEAERAAEAQRQQLEQQQVVPTVAAVVQTPLDNNFYKMFIYSHESGNRTNAINAGSGACGLGQALPCSKLPCSLSDYSCQDAWFSNYAISRYGSWQNAYNWWISHNWW